MLPAPRRVDDDVHRVEREHRDEAHAVATEPTRLVVADRREHGRQATLDRAAAHPVTAILDHELGETRLRGRVSDGRPRGRPGLKDDPDIDLFAAGVERVLHELADTPQRIRVLADEVLDDIAVL